MNNVTEETCASYCLDSPLTSIYVKTKGFTLSLYSLFLLPLCRSSKFHDSLNFWFVIHIYLAKTAGRLVGGLGQEFIRVSSYAHMGGHM